MVQRTVSIKTGKDSPLIGTMFEADKIEANRPAVMFVHGLGSNRIGYVRRAEPLESLGYTCLTFDLRGRGDSEGHRSTLRPRDDIEDITRAYEFLALQRGVDADRIHVVGASYGAYLTAILPSRVSLESIVLRSPPLLADQRLDRPFWLDRFGKLMRHGRATSVADAEGLRALSEFTGKVMIVESEKDDSVPHETLEKFLKAVKRGELRHEVIIGAGHTLSADADKHYIGLLVDWFRTQIATP